MIQFGKSMKPHGIKGEFKLLLFNQEDSSLKKGMKVSLSPMSSESSLNPDGQIFTIESIKFGNQTILKLKEVGDRNLCESMLPFEVYVEESQLPELSNNEFYLRDLINCRVIDYVSKKDIGTIEDFYENGAQVVLQITGEVNLELPFVEAFFPEVDIENKCVYIIEPEEF